MALGLLLAGIAFVPVACHKPAPIRTTPPVTPAADNETPSEDYTPVGEVASPQPRQPGYLVDPNRWLTVTAICSGEAGAWATGSFDPKRNKIDVHTRDVQQFAIDVSRIPIDWQRLVIFRLDGVSTELRKRDCAVYHFILDDHGRWVVREPA